ncbi:MAG: class I SAM-dependent methyltransferase [Rubricoccaceae bacterium]
MSDVPAYSCLAAGYDAVMEHVDYSAWARHVHEMLRRHAPEVQSVIELGCGTGAFARAFQSLGLYDYRGTDGSAAMIAVARERSEGLPLSFDTGTFQDPIGGPPADAILLLYDGLNYLLELADIATLFEHVHDALVPGGVFIVDQSTPANSLNHADGFDDVGETDAFSYVRSSAYDPERRLHTTTFRMSDADGEITETHVQRAYEMQEIEQLLEASPLEIVAAYDEFELAPADASTERIHWVARRVP